MTIRTLLLVPFLVLMLGACGEDEEKAKSGDRATPAPATQTETAGKKAPPDAWVKGCSQELSKDEGLKARADAICTCLAKNVTESDMSAADRQALYGASFSQAGKPEGMSDEGHKIFDEIGKRCVSENQ